MRKVRLLFDTVEELYKNEKAKAVFKKFFGDMADNPRFKPMSTVFTIEGMSKRSAFNIPKELLGVINKELNIISKE